MTGSTESWNPDTAFGWAVWVLQAIGVIIFIALFIGLVKLTEFYNRVTDNAKV
jgi:multisubunit Na+/H+ antiporter MnhG subunit